MLFDLLDIVTSLLLRSVIRRDRAAENAERTPSVFEIQGFTRAFEEWTKARGLVEAPGGVVTGTLAGVRVRVRSGLGGSRPSGLEIEMEIVHEDARARLLTRGSEDPTPLGRALAAAFADPRLESLRSIAVLPGGLRARLLRLSHPEILEAVVETCAGAVRAVHPPEAIYR